MEFPQVTVKAGADHHVRALERLQEECRKDLLIIVRRKPTAHHRDHPSLKPCSALVLSS
jgi:hypothetical protein